jgi:hypothetical protein
MRKSNEHRWLETRLSAPLVALLVAAVAAVSAVAQVGLLLDAAAPEHSGMGRPAVAVTYAAGEADEALRIVASRGATTAPGAPQSQRLDDCQGTY